MIDVSLKGPRSRSGLRRFPLLVVLVLGLFGLSTGSAAFAQSVPRLTGQLTDEAGVIGSSRADVERSLGDLLAGHNVQLYVAFVTTTGSEATKPFTQATFEQNGLGGNDMLLLVAVQDHRYSWWENGAVASLASTEIDQLLSQTLEPRFRASDYAGGVIAFAGTLGTALAAPVGPTAGVTEQPSGGGSPVPQPGFGLDLGPLLGALLIVVGVLILWGWWQQRRSSRLSAEERDRRTGELARQANSLLIAADDGVRDAQQELGFAEAEFDEPDVAPLRTAITAAQTELKAAFTVRQQLDDDVPEDAETRERMLGEIVERAKKITDLLDEQRKRLQVLRDQEEHAPQALDALPNQIQALTVRFPAAQATAERLRSYAEADWQPVRGNLTEAQKRVDAASADVQAGKSALQSTPADPKSAAKSARRAQLAVTEASALLDAVDRLSATLDDATSRLDGEIRAAETDVTAALRAAAESPPGSDLANRLAEAQALLAEAKQQAAAPVPDVILALKDAQRANATADEVLVSVRQVGEQRAREKAALDAALRSAEMSVVRAQDFIATRRNGVEREARTRLAEAVRHLEQARALAATDSAGAAREAGLAGQLADQAYDLARRDFDDWEGRGGHRGDDLGRIILGGIILGNVLGGMGRRGGGWGGTPWGFPGGGGRGGGGGWGGGGFGGGGGRGGGGSW